MAVNLIVFWSTLYTDAVMEQWRTEGYPNYEHINVLERYVFALSETLSQRQLRSLCHPTDSIE